MLKSNFQKIIVDEADHCVKCGKCLSVCPTYLVSQTECESPRGRIAILAAIAEAQIILDQQGKKYLDHCLTCLACETVCPAHVKYRKLFDAGKIYLNQLKRNTFKIKKWLALIIHSKKLRIILRYGIWFYQKMGLQKLFRNIKIFNNTNTARLESYLFPIIKPRRYWHEYHQSRQEVGSRERIGILTGCITDLLEQDVILATIKLLTAAGFEAVIPKQQVCCGALDLHSGNDAAFEKLAAKNIMTFKQAHVHKILSVASGCAVVLREYQGLENIDLTELLFCYLPIEKLKINSKIKKILIQVSCTQKHGLKHADYLPALLRKIPQFEVIVLPQNCCGASGYHLLQYPALAAKLGQEMVKEISKHSPDIILTGNIGCRMHLTSLVTKQALDIPIMHYASFFVTMMQ